MRNVNGERAVHSTQIPDWAPSLAVRGCGAWPSTYAGGHGCAARTNSGASVTWPTSDEPGAREAGQALRDFILEQRKILAIMLR